MKTFVKMKCGNCGHEVTRDPSPMWGGGPHCPNCGADLNKRKLTPLALDGAGTLSILCHSCHYFHTAADACIYPPRQ
jgi:DNA-directed RNA polymerase subunit RPC12/RpoP